MNRRKKVLAWLAAGVVLLIVSLLVINNYAESRIKDALEQNLSNFNATYGEVDVNILNRNAKITSPFLNFQGKTLEVDSIHLTGIQVLDYLFKKKLIAGGLEISNPVIKFYNLKKESDSSDTSSQNSFKKSIRIKEVSVKGGSFQIFEEDSLEHRLYIKLRDLNLHQVRIDSASAKEPIPFNYDLILLNADSLYYDLNQQQELATGSFSIKDNDFEIRDFRLIPKHSKSKHQETIDVEKDRYDLKVKTISMKSFMWNLAGDNLEFKNNYTSISNANLKIYRNKLKPDDLSRKPLYSEMLRNMSVKIGIDSVRIQNSYIEYEENIHEDRETGIVQFANLNASISNLTNIGLERENFPETRVKANADFMKSAALSIDWSFRVNDVKDRFKISGEMGNLAAEEMNRFMKPAMNVRANGEILNMYFNFFGDDDSASGDMRLEYKDFKVEVLRKDGSRKNKLVSTLANLIVSNKALNEKANYKEISVKRDASRSFWNYLWNMVKSGALKSFL